MLQKQLKSLEDLAAAKPMLAEVCQFHQHLYQMIAQSGRFLQIEVDANAAAPRLEQGFPLINGSLLQVDPAAAKTFFSALLALLHLHGQQGKDELQRLQDAVARDDLPLAKLLRAVLDRDRDPISAAATSTGVQPALLEYVVTTALSAALQRCRAEGLVVQVKNWDHGYCPLCGGLPSIAELSGEEGKKLLHCSQCGTHWAFHRLTCIHCGNTDHETLAYFTAEGEPGYRVDICRKCCGYLKVVDTRKRGDHLSLEVEDVATLHLDLLAAKEGFSRGKKETLHN